MQEPRIMKDFGPRPWEIAPYLKQGGYEAWKACVTKWTGEQIIAEIKKAGMRGRGGAGFPTGIKWEKVLNHRIPEHYFVCNAGEHEPGTFKDRHLLKNNPHQLFEGMLIAAHTVKAKSSFIYVNHEYVEELANLRKAADEARAHGFMGKNVLGKGFDLDIEFVEGQGSYVAGALERCRAGGPQDQCPRDPWQWHIGRRVRPTSVPCAARPARRVSPSAEAPRAASAR